MYELVKAVVTLIMYFCCDCKLIAKVETGTA